jgi:hypothetical protein
MQNVASLAAEILQGNGYVLLPELFSPQEVSEARSRILQLAATEPAGRFLKSGDRSRLYRLLGESSLFEQMVLQPPYPAFPVMEIQAIWMMEDFTETNGAPLFAANTQKLCQFPDAQKFGAVAQKVTGKAGSVVRNDWCINVGGDR